MHVATVRTHQERWKGVIHVARVMRHLETRIACCNSNGAQERRKACCNRYDALGKDVQYTVCRNNYEESGKD